MNKKIILLILLIFLLTMVFAIADETDGSSSSARDEWWMIGKDTGYTRYTNANGPANLSDTTVYTTTLPSDVTGGAIVVGDSVFIHPYNYYSAKIKPKDNKNKLSSEVITQIKQLNDLYKAGVLTKEEFEKAKKKILN